MGRKKKWIKHYSNKHKILLVGEGDFSFAACLAEAFRSAINIVATSLDSKKRLLQKHSTAEDNLTALENAGCTIMHGVNAKKMSRHPALASELFDRVVFNFPHAGFVTRESDESQIRMHQKLVRAFFKSAREMLSRNGEVHVTHKATYPFSAWDIVSLASEAGLRLLEEAWFSRDDYPGYINKRGDGLKSNKTFPVGICYTYKFVAV